MNKSIFLIVLNIYTVTILPAAAPKPLGKQTHRLYFLTNMACKVTVLCRMKTPITKKEDEELITITSEPGRNTFLMFEEKESFALRGIGVQPDKNLPAEYTEGSLDSSKPEYGIMFPEPPIIGTESLVVTINETYKAKGFIEEKGALFVHYINCTLQKTGRPTNNPIFEGELPVQDPS